MALIETWLKQDLTAPVVVRRLAGNVFSADNQANLIGVEVVKNGAAENLSGSCVAYCIRADQKTVIVAGTVSGNTAYVTLPQACYAVVGQLSVVLKVDSVTLAAVTGYVYRTSTDTIVDPGTIIPSVDSLIEQIEEAVASIPPDYSALTEEVGNLSSALKSSTGNAIIPVTGTGKYIATNGTTADINSPVDNANYFYCVISASEGDLFTINATGATTPRTWAFINSSGTVLSRAENNEVCVNTLVKAPTNSAYLIINSKVEGTSYIGESLVNRVKKNESDIDNIAKTIIEDLRKYATDKKTQYITSNGTPSNSANWIAFYLNPSDLVKITYVRTYSTSGGVGFYQVSFFNSSTPSSSTLISGVKYTAEGFNTATDIDIPATAVLCIVSCRVSELANSTIEGLFKTATAIEKVNASTVHHLTPDIIMNELSKVSGVSIATDQYTGMKTASFTGESSTTLWATIISDCEQGKAYCLEFYGKINDDTQTSTLTKGAFMKVEFLDGNGNTIGSNYNAYAMGTQNLKYHRYGFVSPLGARKVSIKFYTKANSNMTIGNISLNPIAITPQRKRTGLLLDGHLGMTYVAPENTMPSFELGKIAGFDTMITNINVTSDGVLVALHDNTIDDTSDGTGNVTSFTYEQLLSYDFGSWFNAAYTGTKIPKFEEVVAFLAQSGIRLGVSLHHNLSEQYLSDMCAIIKKYYTTQVLIKSFYLEDILYVRNILGDMAEYMWDGSPTTASIDTIAALDFDVTFEISSSSTSDSDATATLVNYAKSHGVNMSVYYGDDAYVIKHMTDLGVNRFTVNSFSDIVFPRK